MRRVVMAVEMDDPLEDPLGLKEAAVMAMEHLGGRTRVTVVRVLGDEQLAIAGVTPGRPAPAGKPARGGQAPARPKPRAAEKMECCLDCAHFRKEPRRDSAGALLWGVCQRDGRWLDEANKRCAAWEKGN